MRFHTQNLSDGRLSKFWNGRAWLHFGGYDGHRIVRRRTVHWEWSFGKFARSCSARVSFGYGDSDDGILFNLSLPWLFSIYFGWDRFMRVEKECETGVAIHNGAVWFYPLSYSMESNRYDPWYRRTHCWNFPWGLNWWSTEVCEHGRNNHQLRVVWREDHKTRVLQQRDWDGRKAAEKSVSKDYPYSYILKNREVQQRVATVHVTRMEWRARWWPLIPRRKVHTSINVAFDKEVGEETGTWKGGCTGCGYDMKWDETPERCLSRMEHEREFRRH